MSIQKYVENPILYELIDFSQVGRESNKIKKANYKVDFRQWILVKNTKPLEIYILSSYYACVSKKPYKRNEQFFGETEATKEVHVTNFDNIPSSKNSLGKKSRVPSARSIKSKKKDIADRFQQFMPG